MAAAVKRDSGEYHAVNASCEERHKMLSSLVKACIAGVLAAFTAIGAQYLYAGNIFATKEQAKEIKTDLRNDIKEGFDRIEKRLDRIGKP
jgi:hypothetical protein